MAGKKKPTPAQARAAYEARSRSEWPAPRDVQYMGYTYDLTKPGDLAALEANQPPPGQGKAAPEK